MENMKLLVGPLEKGRHMSGSPDVGSILQHEGVWELPKLKSLKRMITNLKSAIIFLQETMMEGEKAKEFLESWLKDWSFDHISLEGNLGGYDNLLESGVRGSASGEAQHSA